MRRLALTLISALSVVVLAACGGNVNGGTAFNTNTNSAYNHLIFTSSGQPEGVFKVAPTATAANALQIFVTGGNSSYNLTQINMTATWAVTYAATGSVYNNNASGAPYQTACPAAPAGNFANPSSALVTGPNAYVAGTFYNYIGVRPVQPVAAVVANPNATPPVVGVPAMPAPPIPYCLNVVATGDNGTQGSVIVYVGY